ncbi:MAG: Nif3-like dinuclear metal center hexameric protein [Clostridia bacterium]|nr:Nif3-like dinuclear metal center hexameric protein [Clostridia bacterium]
MTAGDIYSFINEIAPFDSQCSWDNSGIIIGCAEKEIKKVLVCLDVTEDSAKYAAENGCGLIISHHPVIFRAVKRISSVCVLWTLIKNETCVISAHTNLDKAKGGVNDVLCETLKMDYEKLPEEYAEGFLNCGFINGADSAEKLAGYVSEKLRGPVRYIDSGVPIKKIAVCCGAGGEFHSDAKAAGCSALITGDADHHDFLDAAAEGVSLFAAGHYETEYPVTEALFSRLSEAFPETDFMLYPKLDPILTVK